MTEHLNWDRRLPPSDLPESSIAREFILLTMHKENLSPHEEEMHEETLLGPSGFASKFLERFKDQATTVYGPEYKTLLVKVFPEPETEFDKEVLQHIEGLSILFNNELAGTSIQIASETSVISSGESQDDAFAFCLFDENGAEIVVFTRSSEVWAIIKESDKRFKFKPSLSSRKYLADIAEGLYRSPGPDDEIATLIE